MYRDRGTERQRETEGWDRDTEGQRETEKRRGMRDRKKGRRKGGRNV